ncbi:hypothetical protein PAPYR_3330 [Paratrimastix pyriformis]|uniref:Uncharacterized protein n=1 Tax=Paratrimastix pyriformis TaxID=342808 RepID=A0ABQ8URI2_9EUKA|nr:hypothetical protein PAPYR_3330 [Paratrimastix pyriformis]
MKKFEILEEFQKTHSPPPTPPPQAAQPASFDSVKSPPHPSATPLSPAPPAPSEPILSRDDAQELFRRLHGDEATPEKLVRSVQAASTADLPPEWMAALDTGYQEELYVTGEEQPEFLFEALDDVEGDEDGDEDGEYVYEKDSDREDGHGRRHAGPGSPGQWRKAPRGDGKHRKGPVPALLSEEMVNSQDSNVKALLIMRTLERELERVYPDQNHTDRDRRTRIPPEPIPSWSLLVEPYDRSLASVSVQQVEATRKTLTYARVAAPQTGKAPQQRFSMPVEGTESQGVSIYRPDPIPMAYDPPPGATIRHSRLSEHPETRSQLQLHPTQIDPAILEELHGFQGVLINPPWHAGFTVDHLKAMKPLWDGRCVESGLFFIWVDGAHWEPVMRLMRHDLKLHYADNICWARQRPCCRLMPLPYAQHEEANHFVRSEKITCLIFRRVGKLEMRHQRSADVIFDAPKPGGVHKWEYPAEIRHTIETLLPDGLKQKKLLELWASPSIPPRAGWTAVIHHNYAEPEPSALEHTAPLPPNTPIPPQAGR